MKAIIIYVISLLAIFNPCYSQSIPQDSLYLGQTLPGTTAQIFNLQASTGLRTVERIAISSDNKEIYYGELDSWPASQSRIKYYKYQDNSWQGPFVLFEDFAAPALSMNDSILYIQKSTTYSGATTFFSKRTGNGWSTPEKLFSGNIGTHYFQETNLKNCYTASNPTANYANNDIYRMQIINGDTTRINLGMPINTTVTENDFYIARDESYMLVCRFSSGASDLLISYKKENGTWTNPKTLGPRVNMANPNWECCPFVTKDNQYLFFTRGGNSMSSYYTYWVEIGDLLNSFKLTNFAPYVNSAIPNQTDTLGRTFSYSFADSSFFDDDGNNTLTYSAKLSNGNPLPAWLNFNPATRTFSGTLQEIGTFSIKVTAIDTVQAAVSSTFSLKVVSNTAISESEKFEQLVTAYPNPFNPATKISFTLPEAGQVNLTVFNASGEIIADLLNTQMQSGTHSAVFNAANLNSGVYFYKLTIDGNSVIRKIALIK